MLWAIPTPDSPCAMARCWSSARCRVPTSWQTRPSPTGTAAAWATFAIGMLVFVLLCGVAAMIGMLHGQYHWILIVVPAIPLLLAVAALIVALRKTEGSSIDTIKQQFAADMQALNGPTVKDHEH